jgi:Flagellar hook-length control protein
MAAAQVGREIIRRFDGGNTRFEMRLDPPELGRIEVRLEVTRDHRVSAVIAADNPAALSDLVRHARELEQSLQAAGLELSEQGLSFDLRQGDDEASNAGANDKTGAHNADAAEKNGDPNAPLQTARLERWRGARIDVMA